MPHQNQGQQDVEQTQDSSKYHPEGAEKDHTQHRDQGAAEEYHDAGQDADHLTIAIYSDPGRTSMWIRRLLEDRGEGWSRGAKLVHKQVLIPLRDDDTLDLDEAQSWARQDEADITVIVTEVPRMAGRRPKRAELHFAESLAIISLPALGPVRIRQCLRRELRTCVDALVYDSLDQARAVEGFSSRVVGQRGYDTVYTTAPRGFPARFWTTMGMVAGNEPLWSMPKLSGFFSAAAATGAFGIFFSTIWEMANALPSWRLGVVTCIAVAVVVAWLILANRLWDRPAAVGGKREALMYNLSTIYSLLVSVGLLYLMLFTAILVVGMLLIDPEFLANTIGDDAGFITYVNIAWLSASMGTVAGAVGSNFDDDIDLRNLTQGSRELQRYPRDSEQN